ncbi:glycolate oxidase subunit GlcE [Cobetia sp. UCD-24C]|uniref:glycolate oxidase subunit GlcE n=1 Tax=Cobetia sp. UCD-24C TaxID=1716176 RepID=UPI0009E7D26B|nr:glycolate oxidase subunit GlcE [Cobetia sp. UCD-24C]
MPEPDDSLQDQVPSHAECATPAASQHTQEQDASEALCEQVRAAHEARRPLRIAGSGSKTFLGRNVEAEGVLDMHTHHGITHYDPLELMVSVRAGTPLATLEAVLAEQGQHLSCEPPHFGPEATVGGTLASGLSGPRRPWSGSLRDLVLGTRIISADGKALRFGGEVMKNVAGYDLSRLMCGAQGTLGVISEVSLKVMPRPVASESLCLELSFAEALTRLDAWGRTPLPVTATSWHDGRLTLRLEGGERSVQAGREQLGGEVLMPDQASAQWTELREHRLPFFTARAPHQALWRLSLPLALDHVEWQAAVSELLGHLEDADLLCDWAGAQRWLYSDAPADRVRSLASRLGGHAICYTPGAVAAEDSPLMPLAAINARYHLQLKQQLDPHGILNPGRLYAEM